MTPDSITLAIAGGVGAFAGFGLGFSLASVFVNEIRRRTIKETWDCARRYYTLKKEESV